MCLYTRVCLYTCVLVHVFVPVRTYVYMYVYSCTYILNFACTHVYLYTTQHMWDVYHFQAILVVDFVFEGCSHSTHHCIQFQNAGTVGPSQRNTFGQGL